MTRSNKARASGRGERLVTVRKGEMRRTISIVDADQESEVATDVFDFVTEGVQSLFKDPAGNSFVVEAVVFHEGCKCHEHRL